MRTIDIDRTSWSHPRKREDKTHKEGIRPDRVLLPKRARVGGVGCRLHLAQRSPRHDHAKRAWRSPGGSPSSLSSSATSGALAPRGPASFTRARRVKTSRWPSRSRPKCPLLLKSEVDGDLRSARMARAMLESRRLRWGSELEVHREASVASTHHLVSRSAAQPQLRSLCWCVTRRCRARAACR
jgi:hypothetical protein